jgi:hypothetical protein
MVRIKFGPDSAHIKRKVKIFSALPGTIVQKRRDRKKQAGFQWFEYQAPDCGKRGGRE